MSFDRRSSRLMTNTLTAATVAHAVVNRPRHTLIQKLSMTCPRSERRAARLLQASG
jgi:hypothetical protein